MEYTHEQAVADAVNVDFDVYRIRTEISEQGGTIDAGLVTAFRDRQTRAAALGEARRGRRLRRRGARPGGRRQGPDPHGHPRRSRSGCSPRSSRAAREVPKTLIFAKDDSHADDIVQIVREEFGKGNDFAVKITYKSTGRKPDEMIAVVPQLVQPADRRDRRHDRHRHRRAPARVRVLHALGQEPHLLRADEGPRRRASSTRPTSRRSPPTRARRAGS